MSPARSPDFEALARSACEDLLARHHVGRVAYSFHSRVEIEPIHYVYEDGWIYGRTSPGSKIETLRHSHWVAFEVDEVRGQFDWESVVVHGAFFPLAPEGTALEQEAWRRARAAVQKLAPDAWTESDPASFRSIPFRIDASDMTGRAARLG